MNIFQVPGAGRASRARRELPDIIALLLLLLLPLLGPPLDAGVVVREGPAALTIKVIHQNLLIGVLDDLYLVVFVIFNFGLRGSPGGGTGVRSGIIEA